MNQDSVDKGKSSKSDQKNGQGPTKRLKLSHLDYLTNPLRADHPFGKSPFPPSPSKTFAPGIITPQSKINQSVVEPVARYSEVKPAITPAEAIFCAFEAGMLTLLSLNVELWSMKEMAIFNACICQFGKRFDLFVPMVSTIHILVLFYLSTRIKQHLSCECLP